MDSRWPERRTAMARTGDPEVRLPGIQSVAHLSPGSSKLNEPSGFWSLLAGFDPAGRKRKGGTRRRLARRQRRVEG